MYTEIIKIFFLLFIKKFIIIYKKLFSHHSTIMNFFLSAKYKNGKPNTEFIIK